VVVGANRRSFWVRRGQLIRAVRVAGLDPVPEQFDGPDPPVTESMLGV
jgi:hypothetical protein